MTFRASVCSVLWLVLLLGLSSCSVGVRKQASKAYPADVDAILSGQAILGRVATVSDLPDVNVFALTPEMIAFAEKAVRRTDSEFDQVKALHRALLLPIKEGGRGITYSAFSTQIPTVTFQERQANCLSFSLLYVAMARHLKLNAHVNEVKIPPTWGLRKDNSFMFFRHVNVKVPLRKKGALVAWGEDAVIDLEMNRYKTTYPQQYIDDSLAAAQFYSNHGIELADEGKLQEGFFYLRKALQENDQQSYIWNNLASIFSKQNLWREAEVIYLYGLEVDSSDLSIMNNLAELYRKMGNSKQQEMYYKLAENHRQTNPFYQYVLALSAFSGGDNLNALVYVKHAILRNKNEIRFYQLAASIYEKLGDVSGASKMNKKYKSLLSEGV